MDGDFLPLSQAHPNVNLGGATSVTATSVIATEEEPSTSSAQRGNMDDVQEMN